MHGCVGSKQESELSGSGRAAAMLIVPERAAATTARKRCLNCMVGTSWVRLEMLVRLVSGISKTCGAEELFYTDLISAGWLTD